MGQHCSALTSTKPQPADGPCPRWVRNTLRHMISPYGSKRGLKSISVTCLGTCH